MQGLPVSAVPTQRLRSLKAHAPIARVWVFPVSARGSPFSTKVVPLAQLSHFVSFLRRKKQRSSGSFSAGSSGVTSAQRLRALPSPHSLISPVCFTQEDQCPSSAVSGLVSFGTSEEDVIIEDEGLLVLGSVWCRRMGRFRQRARSPSPSQTLRPDAELIHVLSKAVEDLGWKQRLSQQRLSPPLMALTTGDTSSSPLWRKQLLHICARHLPSDWRPTQRILLSPVGPPRHSPIGLMQRPARPGRRNIQWRFSKCFRPSFSTVWTSLAKYTRRLSKSCAQQQT